MSEKLKEVIKAWDMADEMKQEVVQICKQAFEDPSRNTEKDIATYIKDEVRLKYHGTWHCIVGRNFGSFVTFEKNYYIYLYLGQMAILLFKTG